jgi:hypothetical protein
MINPVVDGASDIVEVTSTNKEKEEQLYEVAFQGHCCC